VTDKTHIEEFSQTITEALSRKLVAVFMERHCDHTLKESDVITRLKEQMEAALGGHKDAAS